MPVDTADRLGDLVTEDPRRSRVLEQLGLDYCCHGERTLAQACSEAGLDAAEVAGRLDIGEPGPAPDWQGLGIADLARHILDVHHRYLWDEMPALGDLVDLVVRVHGQNHPELAAVGVDYYALITDLTSHLAKEEQILFPAIIALGDPQAGPAFPGSLRGPITQMLREHDVAGDLLRRIRAATKDFAVPGDACASYKAMLSRLEQMESDLHEHIHKENNVLFPRVLDLESGAA